MYKYVKLSDTEHVGPFLNWTTHRFLCSIFCDKCIFLWRLWKCLIMFFFVFMLFSMALYVILLIHLFSSGLTLSNFYIGTIIIITLNGRADRVEVSWEKV